MKARPSLLKRLLADSRSIVLLADAARGTPLGATTLIADAVSNTGKENLDSAEGWLSMGEGGSLATAFCGLLRIR